VGYPGDVELAARASCLVFVSILLVVAAAGCFLILTF
jgi:hypothetical protein